MHINPGPDHNTSALNSLIKTAVLDQIVMILNGFGGIQYCYCHYFYIIITVTFNEHNTSSLN